MFRLWITRYDNWQPQHWYDVPPAVVTTEPAEDRPVPIEEAIAFLEGFNGQMLRESQTCWAIAAPVTIQYRGDFAPNERVVGTSVLECLPVATHEARS